MGQKQKSISSSRRKFLSLFNLAQTSPVSEKVKMLTADGKLVEIDKDMLEKVSTKKKATNKEILAWMNNPSKER